MGNDLAASPALGTTIRLRSGVEMPCPGFGTWRLGEDPRAAGDEERALKRALERGFRHLDTAEMSAEGGSEALIGRVLEGVDRTALFLCSKFYPYHARADEMVAACERSLSRLGTEYLDLYLLHWPGSTPFAETLEGAHRLIEAGKIRAFGVSNFDMREMQSIIALGEDTLIDVNQVLYNPSRRGIEFDLLPLLAEHRIVCVAYTPIEPRRLAGNTAFRQIAAGAGLSPATLAFAWHLARGAACPIPKAARLEHVDALADAASVTLGPELLAAIDAAFPPPTRAQPLEIL
ncbi:MAG: aldo/keto reductase [Pseudomonadota bacterium]